MKTTSIITTICVLLCTAPASAGSYCPSDNHTRHATATQSTNRAQTRLLIEGMTSAACPLLVKTALRTLQGVEGVAIDAPKKIVTVTYDPGRVSVPEIQTTIKGRTGFDSKALN